VLELWQQCTIFLAPTPTMNWGVYANIDFQKGDIVDVAGLTIPMADESAAVERSILNDYVYGYWRIPSPSSSRRRKQQRQDQDKQHSNKPTIQQLYSVMLGYDMYYNHNATPNIEFQTFGREPFHDDVAMNAQGFVALRDIARGEELWCSYKSGNERDGGLGWFHQRDIELKTLSVEDTQLSPTQLEEYSQQYCSKITATISSLTWQQRVMSLWPSSLSRRPFEWMKEFPYLPPTKDAGWGQAYAKVSIASGQRIELSTGLIMSYSRHIQGTALRPISYTWHDLFPHQQLVIKQLHDQNQLVVQYQGPDTDWKSINKYGGLLEDVVLFPAAGNIGMVQRKIYNNQATNCHLVLHPPILTTTVHHHHSLTNSVTMELVATRNIKVGDVLVVNVPILNDRNDDVYSSTSTIATRREYELLHRELQQSGQIFEKSIFRHYLHDRREPPDEL
jgi:hypothetical protein